MQNWISLQIMNYGKSASSDALCRIGRLFVVLETKTSDHILLNAVAIYVIPYVNTCVTKATTNQLCYQPHGGKWNHTGWAAWAPNTMVKQLE